VQPTLPPSTDAAATITGSGFALQLYALRYPGRLLRPGELIPTNALRFIAEQIGVAPEALADHAARFQTRYQQLDALSATFGFSDFTPSRRREILAWLCETATGSFGKRIFFYLPVPHWLKSGFQSERNLRLRPSLRRRHREPAASATAIDTR
jgi:hypothetical protein